MQDFNISVTSNELEVLKNLVDCLSRQFLHDVPGVYDTAPNPKAVYLVMAGMDLSLSIILLEDVAEYLPCFDEGDMWYSISGTPIVASYCPNQVANVAGKNYLIGPMVFFRINKKFNTVSLTLGDLHYILKFLHDRKIVFETGDEIFEAICLD